MLAECIADHQQHQWRRQRQTDGDRREACHGEVSATSASRDLAWLVTNVANRATQTTVVRLCRIESHSRRFGGEIHRRLGDPWHFLQRPLNAGPQDAQVAAADRECLRWRAAWQPWTRATRVFIHASVNPAMMAGQVLVTLLDGDVAFLIPIPTGLQIGAQMPDR